MVEERKTFLYKMLLLPLYCKMTENVKMERCNDSIFYAHDRKIELLNVGKDLILFGTNGFILNFVP